MDWLRACFGWLLQYYVFGVEFGFGCCRAVFVVFVGGSFVDVVGL